MTAIAARHGGGEEAVPAWTYRSTGERLSASLERRLIERAQGGDERARERLIGANVPLVYSLAGRSARPGLELADLVQEGMLGLCVAIARFDCGRGLRFSTYATYWIRQRIMAALERQARLIRLPAGLTATAQRLEGVRQALAGELQREPSPEELATTAGVSERRLRQAMTCAQDPLSLQGSGEEASGALEIADDRAPDPQAMVLAAEERARVRAAVSALPARDRAVLEARFGLGGREVPLPDLAERLSLSRDALRQAQHRALIRLRRHLQEGAELAA